MNDTDRRWELIYKDICGKLSTEESEELEKLNQQIPKQGISSKRKSKLISEEEFE